MVIFCSLPVALSVPTTLRMPFASMSNDDLDLRHAARRRQDAVEDEARRASCCPAPSARSPCRTWISTEVWLSAAVVNDLRLRLVGIVVLRGISGVATPPRVSMPSVSGVTSSSSTSLTSPLSTPAWIAAPTATTSSGFTPLCGSLPKNFLTFS